MMNKAKYGLRALKPQLVEKTWWGILQEQESLSDDWLRTGTGVTSPIYRTHSIIVLDRSKNRTGVEG